MYLWRHSVVYKSYPLQDRSLKKMYNKMKRLCQVQPHPVNTHYMIKVANSVLRELPCCCLLTAVLVCLHFLVSLSWLTVWFSVRSGEVAVVRFIALAPYSN